MGDSIQIKSVTLDGKGDFKIESHIRQEEITGEYALL